MQNFEKPVVKPEQTRDGKRVQPKLKSDDDHAKSNATDDCKLDYNPAVEAGNQTPDNAINVCDTAPTGDVTVSANYGRNVELLSPGIIIDTDTSSGDRAVTVGLAGETAHGCDLL